MQRLSHRVLLAGIALFLSSPVVAQSWPQRPVSVVVPQPAGNSPDVLCRVIADKLSRALGQQFIVENRAGAANLVGTQSVARAAPDGYTFLFATSAARCTCSASRWGNDDDPIGASAVRACACPPRHG